MYVYTWYVHTYIHISRSVLMYRGFDFIYRWRAVKYSVLQACKYSYIESFLVVYEHQYFWRAAYIKIILYIILYADIPIVLPIITYSYKWHSTYFLSLTAYLHPMDFFTSFEPNLQYRHYANKKTESQERNVEQQGACILTFRNLASGIKLPSRCPILYIYSTNIRTEYFKHAV